MIEVLILGAALGAGAVIGVLFFGGLWWTVRRGVSSPRPVLWFLGSWVMRMGIALAGFYVVSGGHWDRLLACLVGFVIARFAVTWFAGPPMAVDRTISQEAGHAS